MQETRVVELSQLEEVMNDYLRGNPGSTFEKIVKVPPTDLDAREVNQRYILVFNYDSGIESKLELKGGNEGFRALASSLRSKGKNYRILGVLYEEEGEIVSYETLFEIGKIEPPKARDKLAVITSKLKQKAEQKGFLITNVWNKGYKIERIVDFDSVDLDAKKDYLSPIGKKIFQVLYRAKDKGVSPKELYEAVYGESAEENKDYRGKLNSSILWVRPYFNKIDLRIVFRRGIGYKLFAVKDYQKPG